MKEGFEWFVGRVWNHLAFDTLVRIIVYHRYVSFGTISLDIHIFLNRLRRECTHLIYASCYIDLFYCFLLCLGTLSYAPFMEKGVQSTIIMMMIYSRIVGREEGFYILQNANYSFKCQSMPRYFHLSHGDEVVDFEDHSDALCGERYLGGIDEQRLDHVLGPHVADLTLSNVDSRIEIARGMAITQLRHESDRVDSCVLGQGVRNDLKSLTSIRRCYVVKT